VPAYLFGRPPSYSHRPTALRAYLFWISIKRTLLLYGFVDTAWSSLSRTSWAFAINCFEFTQDMRHFLEVFWRRVTMILILGLKIGAADTRAQSLHQFSFFLRPFIFKLRQYTCTEQTDGGRANGRRSRQGRLVTRPIRTAAWLKKKNKIGKINADETSDKQNVNVHCESKSGLCTDFFLS